MKAYEFMHTIRAEMESSTGCLTQVQVTSPRTVSLTFFESIEEPARTAAETVADAMTALKIGRPTTAEYILHDFLSRRKKS